MHSNFKQSSDSKAKTDFSVWKNKMSLSRRIGFILISYFTFFLSIAILCIIFIPYADITLRIFNAIFILYLVPPLCARLLLIISPISLGIVTLTSNDFIKWWALFNMQVIFSRLPFLEEFLRMIPGIYGPWLRLWGSKIGRLTYWAPGLKILDRSFLKIGDDVLFGADVRINSHVMYEDENKELVLALDYVTLGDRTMIGGYSLFTAGTIIYPDQATRAVLCLPPFTHFKDGKRLKDDTKKENPAYGTNPLQIHL
ncbi:MAG: hypothetical protein ACD_79C01221G0010 [uncultured bacterium]|nr:MAG: hypothetical protein ACD_79C01221G0010 [uncultured bacterium]